MNMQPRTDNNSAPDNHVVDFGKFHNVSMGELFNLPELDQKFLGVFENDKYVPKITKDYAFNVSALRSILSFLYRPTDGDGLMLYGPFGCGKTSLIREILGRVKYPTLMLSWNETSDTADLVGRVGLSFGNTEFEYGPLAIAAKYGYALVVNEVDRGRAGNLVALNDMLDGGNLVIKETGEVIVPHERFRLICTANSAGNGDMTGSYTGSVRKLDPAFMDRFGLIRMDYMDTHVEIDLMMQTYPLFAEKAAPYIAAISEFASDTRKSGDDISEGISTPMSTRAIHRFFRYAEGMGLHKKLQSLHQTHGGVYVDKETGSKMFDVMELCYFNRLSPDDRETAVQLYTMKIPTINH